MAAKLMLPLRQEENEVQQAAASAPWSMWRTRSAVGVEDEDDSWEVRAFADDTAGLMGGATWPPRSYSCTFCRREFRSAQALGGHMNVHRRDRARLRQSPPSGAPQDHHHHQHQPAGAFPLPEIMPTQEFPLCFLYPMPAPNSGTDQKPLLYALNPNSSMVSSSLLHSTPPLVPMSSDGGHGNSNSNLVEFFPRKSSPSSSSSPSTVLSISALSSPPGPSRLTSPAISAIKNISNGSNSAGISERTRRSDERPEKLKQIGAFHPYLPAPSRRDHQNKSSDEHSRLYGDQYLNMLNPDEGDSKENIDLELRLGQTKI